MRSIVQVPLIGEAPLPEFVWLAPIPENIALKASCREGV
jgi:hypothetical protein